MRVLAVKRPWSEKIVTGQKTWEIRSRKTNIRERVAIYATLTKPDYKDIQWLESIGHGTNDMVRGHIIGTVELYNCQPTYSQHLFDANVDKHLCPPNYHKPGEYAWHLRDAKRFQPIPYKMKKGAIIWGSIDDSIIEGAL